MIKSLLRQQTLGEFLRKHRELISEPLVEKQTVGRRRRIKGLRREEISQMAGISVTWYSRLEQGKEIAPSSDLLGRIANVLRLEPAERTYLFQLAGRVDRNDTADDFEDERVITAIKSCMSSISSPAYMLDKYWTPLFWNAGFESLFSPWLNGPEINVLRHIFLDPNARTFVADWELHARHLVAQFRIDFGRHIEDPKMLELVRALREESDFFRSVWKDQQALLRDEDEEAYHHPRFGLLRFSQTTFLAVANPALKLVILTPRS